MSRRHERRLARCTLIPSALIRNELPTLKMAELKVVLVVADQTLGWIDPATGGRKEADWLTHSQLKARTGCASEALSRAIDSLVRRNLIEVLSDTGEFLFTAHSRRRCAGRLFFKLSDRVLNGLTPVDPVDKSVDISIAKAAGGHKNEEGASVSEIPTSQSGLRKPKTTQNNRYIKYISDGRNAPLTSQNKYSAVKPPHTVHQLRRSGGWSRAVPS